MADGIIQLSPDSTGKKVDTEELVVGANTVHRERMQIAGDSATDIAPVTAADGLLVNLGTNNDVTVAGGATLAEQQAQSALLTTIDADTSSLAGAVAGSEVQVDVVAALPAGNNNIGDVDIASLPNEGQQTMANSISVAIASDQSTVPVSLAAGGTTQYAEDSAHVSGDLVTMAGVVQQTADAALSSDGDRSALQVDATGWAKVNVKGSALPTGAATAANQTTVITHLATIAGDTTDIETAVELIDDTVAVLGTDTYTEATTKGLIIGAIRRDADTTLVNTTNEVSPLQVDANGRLKVEAFSGETLPVSISGGATLAEQQTQTTALTAIQTAVQIMDDWDETDRAKVNPIAGQAGVQGASGVVTALTQRVVLATDVGLPAGTANIGDVDVLTMPVVEIVGDVAADAAVPTNPVIVGGRASTAQPTPVSADGDSVNMWMTRKGSPVGTMAPHVGLLADPWALTGETAQYTTTQTSAVLVAGGASERLVVTKVQIQVGGTTAGTMQLYFGTGAYSRGTTLAIFDGEFAPSATLKPGVVMDGPFISAANGDDLLVTTSAAINPLTITVWYYVIT